MHYDRTLTGGRAVITPGVAALGQAAVARIIKTIAVFDDFCQANDPYEEHDFGAFEAEGHTIFFKVDYFDSDLYLSLARPCESRRDRTRAHHHARGRILRARRAWRRLLVRAISAERCKL